MNPPDTKPAPARGNLFEHVTRAGPDERINSLVDRNGVTVERIVSHGHASPPDFWYDSPRAEWVVLLSGAATLEFEGDPDACVMKPGDHVLIEAHRRHRVASTGEAGPSVWLAVHYPE
jgi:cupin 2 domain-containing protein